MIGGMVRISSKELIDKPKATTIVKRVGQRSFIIHCHKNKRFGNRLICPICGRRVASVYLPEDKNEFGCRQCYRQAFEKIRLPRAYAGLFSKLPKSWIRKQC